MINSSDVCEKDEVDIYQFSLNTGDDRNDDDVMYKIENMKLPRDFLMTVKGLGKLVPVCRNLQAFSETSFASETEILIVTQEVEDFFDDATDELDRAQGCVTSDES